MDIRGKATGRARLISPSKPSVGLLAGINCDSTSIAGRPVGRLQVLSLWDDIQDRFDIRVRNDLDGTRNIDLAGFPGTVPSRPMPRSAGWTSATWLRSWKASSTRLAAAWTARSTWPAPWTSR